MIGKVDVESLAELVFGRTGHVDPSVIQGPGYGEDAAAIDLGDQTLVVSSDPLSLAVDRLGTLGVHVAANDVAVAGADPRWLTTVVFLPDADPVGFDTITAQLHETAQAAGIAIVGGHSEYAPSLERPLLSLTCLGLAERFIPTSGAQAGDRLVLTKGAGLEATAILATDFRARLEGIVPPALLDEAEGYFEEISVVPDAQAVREYATAMHDPTEGGLIDGLIELAVAAGVRTVVTREAVPVREATAACCAAVDVDPLRVFGSGSLLASVPPDDLDAMLSALGSIDLDATVIGTVEPSDDPALVLDGDVYSEPVSDELYPLWE